MKGKIGEFAWPAIGIAAVGLSIWLLLREVRSLSIADVIASLESIPTSRLLAAVAATALAYVALAEYDRIALRHLGRHLPYAFVSLTSFTAYALSHNIGASVLSGAVVRYRAYTSRGMKPADVAVLVAFCSFTFTLSTVLLGGIVLLIKPSLLRHYFDAPVWVGLVTGAVLVGVVALYAGGSMLRLPPLRIRSFALSYPRPAVVLRQLIVGPLEIIGAASIVFVTLPVEGNPGFVTVLGIFIASFSAALISHAPGGLGVLEYSFVSALEEIDPADVLAALIIFRILYLLVPLALSLVAVFVFERRQMSRPEG
jgi:uncharacterized membrane protein YbhN (UPF0104 family)